MKKVRLISKLKSLNHFFKNLMVNSDLLTLTLAHCALHYSCVWDIGGGGFQSYDRVSEFQNSGIEKNVTGVEVAGKL